MWGGAGMSEIEALATEAAPEIGAGGKEVGPEARRSPGLQPKSIGGTLVRMRWEVGDLGKLGNVLSAPPPL